MTGKSLDPSQFPHQIRSHSNLSSASEESRGLAIREKSEELRDEGPTTFLILIFSPFSASDSNFSSVAHPNFDRILDSSILPLKQQGKIRIENANIEYASSVPHLWDTTFISAAFCSMIVQNIYGSFLISIISTDLTMQSRGPFCCRISLFWPFILCGNESELFERGTLCTSLDCSRSEMVLLSSFPISPGLNLSFRRGKVPLLLLLINSSAHNPISLSRVIALFFPFSRLQFSLFFLFSLYSV